MKNLKTIILIFIASIAIIGLLHILSLDNSSNSFTRNFRPKAIKLIKKLNVEYNSYYIAGKSGHHLYFGNSVSKLFILKTNDSLGDKQSIKLDKEVLEKFKGRSPYLVIDSSFFYLMDGPSSRVFKGNLDTWEYAPLKPDHNNFTFAYPIGINSFVAKAISQVTRKNIIKKWQPGSNAVTPDKNILQEQIDGLFCTDGMLQYDRSSSRIYFTYTYRNQFICMDTNLKVLSIGKTIDTNTIAKIKVAKYISGATVKTLASPLLIVNKRFSISNGYLFINSNLISDNESKIFFKNSNTIDVYNLKNNEYKFSFHIHTKHKSDLKDFKVLGKTLIVINDKYIEIYGLSDRFFND